MSRFDLSCNSVSTLRGSRPCALAKNPLLDVYAAYIKPGLKSFPGGCQRIHAGFSRSLRCSANDFYAMPPGRNRYLYCRWALGNRHNREWLPEHQQKTDLFCRSAKGTSPESHCWFFQSGRLSRRWYCLRQFSCAASQLSPQ